MQPMPVIIEDLIRNVTNSKLHHEKRQHYAVTLETIVKESQKALAQYERDRMMVGVKQR